MATNLPEMASSAYTSSSYEAGNFGQAKQAMLLGNAQQFGDWQHKVDGTLRAVVENVMAVATRRIVKVIIADPNENMPLDDCILFTGSEKLTDATDQELFFELDIKGLLEAHNAKRVKVMDKKVKDRTEYLEPAKVRDLKMVVVTVAAL